MFRLLNIRREVVAMEGIVGWKWRKVRVVRVRYRPMAVAVFRIETAMVHM